jgi:hypothetical protein
MTEMLLKKKQNRFTKERSQKRDTIFLQIFDIRAFLIFLAFETMGGKSAPRHR